MGSINHKKTSNPSWEMLDQHLVRYGESYVFKVSQPSIEEHKNCYAAVLIGCSVGLAHLSIQLSCCMGS